MARRRAIEEQLAALHQLRGSPVTAEVMRDLRAALQSKSGLVAAAAAEVAGEAGADELAGELEAAFARFLVDPVKRDPRCAAKLAIARALVELSRWSEEVFAAGIRDVQLEPVFGGREDTAAGLRGVSALAYAQLGQPDAVIAIADLLADPEAIARAAAARALGDSGRPDAIPLLRFKARIGDAEAEVLSAVFGSLLALDPADSLSFVAGFLEASGPAADAAALALGESRSSGALPPLLRWVAGAASIERRRVGFLALALLRLDAATDFLLHQIRTEAPASAEAAARALAPFSHDGELAARVRAAAADNRSRQLDEVVAHSFAEPPA
jgi:HEAT repeat protein